MTHYNHELPFLSILFIKQQNTIRGNTVPTIISMNTAIVNLILLRCCHCANSNTFSILIKINIILIYKPKLKLVIIQLTIFTYIKLYSHFHSINTRHRHYILNYVVNQKSHNLLKLIVVVTFF